MNIAFECTNSNVKKLSSIILEMYTARNAIANRQNLFVDYFSLLLFRFDLGAVHTNCDDIIRKKVRNEENIVCVHIEYDFEQSNLFRLFSLFFSHRIGWFGWGGCTPHALWNVRLCLWRGFHWLWAHFLSSRCYYFCWLKPHHKNDTAREKKRKGKNRWVIIIRWRAKESRKRDLFITFPTHAHKR